MSAANPFSDRTTGLEPGRANNPSAARTMAETDGPLARGFRSRRKASPSPFDDPTTGMSIARRRTSQKPTATPDENPQARRARAFSGMGSPEKGGGGVKEVAGRDQEGLETGRTSVIGGLRATGRNLRAMGEGVIEQTPDMIAQITGGMLAGGFAGAKLVERWSTAVAPGAGTAAGATLGWPYATDGRALLPVTLPSKAATWRRKRCRKPESILRTAQAVRLVSAGARRLDHGDRFAVKGGIIGAVDVGYVRPCRSPAQQPGPCHRSVAMRLPTWGWMPGTAPQSGLRCKPGLPNGLPAMTVYQARRAPGRECGAQRRRRRAGP